MGVLADLVPKAQPALFSGTDDASGTEGATWLWEFVDFTDDNGDPIDLTGVTGVCEVITEVGGTVVTPLDFTGNANGTCSVGRDEADTVGLAAGASRNRRCAWYFTLDDGDDLIYVWGPVSSPFYIRPGA